MIHTTDEIYTAIAERIREQYIDRSGSNTYSLEFDTADGDMTLRFVATLMFYTTTSREDWGAETLISDVIPVWWEMHTTTDEGEQVNDFDFETFREYLIN